MKICYINNLLYILVLFLLALILYNAFIRSNPIEVSKLMNELKARDVFQHKEYYSRLNSKIRKIQKDEIVENDLMDELNKKVEEIYLELI